MGMTKIRDHERDTMTRTTRIRCLPSILTTLAGLIGVSGGAIGAASDADGAKQAAPGLSKAADALRERIREVEPRVTFPVAKPSPLTTHSVMLCIESERLVYHARTYSLTRSFIDLRYCDVALGNCHKRILDLRREAQKLPEAFRKSLFRDLMVSFRQVDVALYGGKGRYPIPHDPVLDA